MRVLVVEDDGDLSRQLVAALTDAGYAADAAFDGEDGSYRSVADVTSPESLQKVRDHKKEMKAAASAQAS